MSIAARLDRMQESTRRLLLLAGGIAVVCVSAAVGVGLAAFANIFGESAPLLILLPPILAAFAVGVLADTKLGIALIYASFPLGFAALELGPLDIQAVDAAVLLATALVALSRLTERKTPLRFHAILWLGVLLAVWAVIALPSASDQPQAIKATGSLMSGVIVAALAYTVAAEAASVRTLLWWFVGLGVLVVLPALTSAGEFRAYYGGALVEGRLQGIFADPNELGSFCSMSSLVTGALGLSARTRSLRVAAGILLCLQIVGLLLSLSRGAWLGTFVGLVFLIITLRSARRLVAGVSVPLIMIFLVVNTLVPNNPQVQIVGQRVQAITNLDQPYDDRPAIWAEAVRQIRADPLTGSGPGNFGAESHRLASTGVSVYTSHAHNVYLNLAAEMGLPALLFFLGLIGAMAFVVRASLRSYREHKASSERLLVVAVGAALLSLAVQGVTNNFLGNAVIDATMWSFVGFALALSAPRRSASSPSV